MKNHARHSAKEDIDRALALLISSTRRKTRVVSLTVLADAISVARQKFGSTAELARAIGLSGKMLGQFCRVNNLEPEPRKLVSDRQIDSVDAVVHLAQLSPADQILAAREVANGELDTKDLRALVELRKRDPYTAFAQLAAQTRASKTRLHYVLEFVVRGRLSELETRERFERVVNPSNLLEISVKGSFGRVVLNGQGYSELRSAAKHRSVTTKQLTTLLTSQ